MDQERVNEFKKMKRIALSLYKMKSLTARQYKEQMKEISDREREECNFNLISK